MLSISLTLYILFDFLGESGSVLECPLLMRTPLLHKENLKYHHRKLPCSLLCIRHYRKLRYGFSLMHFIVIFLSWLLFSPSLKGNYFLESILFAISFSFYTENLTEGTFSKFRHHIEVTKIGLFLHINKIMQRILQFYTE